MIKRTQYPRPAKGRSKYFKLNVLPDNLWLNVNAGDTIFDALRKNNVDLKSECNGLGKCGKCKVRILSSIEPISQDERNFISQEEIDQGVRLACRTPVKSKMVIQIEEPRFGSEYFQILQTSHSSLFQLDPLIHKQHVFLTPLFANKGASTLDRIKLAMGPDYGDLTASLGCLASLPEKLKQTETQGVAVLHEKSLLDWQNWEKLGHSYGLVFDLGTTTLVGKLINLLDGAEIAVKSQLNSQIRHGTNVISRLQYVKDHAAGLDSMHDILTENLNDITRGLLEVAGLSTSDIFVVIAGGNTTMQHFLLKLPPDGIAEAPFAPILTDGMRVKAAEVGLDLHPEAQLFTMPMKSGYIGGDLISTVLASGAVEQEDEIILGLDIGTNAEIFLGNRKRMLTCSAAAGPAFEGARISHGMIATDGAIEAVYYENDKLNYRDISNIKPKGLCGSGLVDLVAVLVKIGIIDKEGLIVHPKENNTGKIFSRVIDCDGVNSFLVATAQESYHNKPIYLTQKDVRELQLAKSAIAAGVEILISDYGIRLDDINRICLAGALGNYVNPLSALRIGLLPPVNPDIIVPLGNAASYGSSMALLSKYYWQMANELGDSIEHIELSSRLDFNDYFVEFLNFP
ncbi:MAG: ASKHA domain-containing protein [Thermodesulfobacteriota bacterium]|nr:ASKHA domain-containing protein [Thermodesulfobacteriota bacterium]